MKYKIGDRVWRLLHRKAVEETIMGVYFLPDRFVYATQLRKMKSDISAWDFLDEEELFESKEALIASL